MRRLLDPVVGMGMGVGWGGGAGQASTKLCDRQSQITEDYNNKSKRRLLKARVQPN